VALSLLAFLGIYGILGLLDIWLLQKYARLGPPAPDPADAGADDAETAGPEHSAQAVS
jgi:cytochrome bd-type quinol oxidase subunit 1